MPSWSSESSSSRAEHSMPWLSSPRIFAFLIVTPPGSVAPTVASGTIMPARTFGAPHTTRSSPAPPSTRHSDSLSAFGCFCTSSTRATTTPGYERPCASMPST